MTGNDGRTMLDLLSRWQKQGFLKSLDVALAALLLGNHDGNDRPLSPLVLLGAALTSYQTGRGHVCLHLGRLAADPLAHLALSPAGAMKPGQRLDDGADGPAEVLLPISRGLWISALAESLGAVERVDGSAQKQLSTQGNTPLVLAGDRLYLRRYWRYEQIIANGILDRLHRRSPLQEAESSAARSLQQAVDKLFPDSGDSTDWQRLACCLAARNHFSIVTGGPGTGKTTTVLRLLAVLQSVAMADPQQIEKGLPRIRLAAPTGKAAARLSESISAAVDKLDLSGLQNEEVIRAGIPGVVTTLHRLLGSRPGTRAFRHNTGRRLSLDVLVIDEASMIDVEMMARVIQALPDDARLILIGDKDQLSSVDSGAVLGELCQRASGGYYDRALADWLETVAGERPDNRFISSDAASTLLDRSVTMLRHTYRFGSDSGIARLAELVNAGELTQQTFRPFEQAGFADLAILAPAPGDQSANAARLLTAHSLTGTPDAFSSGQGTAQPPATGYRHYLEIMSKTAPTDATQRAIDAWASSILTAFNSFRLLTPLRNGPFGVDTLNDIVAKALHAAGLISSTEGWYAGRPVLITRNDYALGLMNGDVGIVLPIAEDDSTLRVVFPSERGLRWISPGRLNHVDTVFAMTVHKSQGSEFAHACLVMPDRPAPVLTRELVYTGITRAKSYFSMILPQRSVLLEAAKLRVERSSGLGEMLGLTSTDST